MSQANDHVAPLVTAQRRKEVDLRLVPLGFAALILVGAVLLLLPWAHRPGHSIGWLVIGADLVVLPTRDMAYRLAERLRDNVGSDRQQLCGNHQLAQIRIGPPLHGKTLAEAALPQRYHVTLVLLTRGNAQGEAKALEPAPDLKMATRDLLFVAGRRENINRFERECGEQSAAT